MNQSAEAVTLHVGEATVSIPAKSLVLAWLEKETRGTAAPLQRFDALGLPQIGDEYEGGLYGGLTIFNNTPQKLIVLPGEFDPGNWQAYLDWCKQHDGEWMSRVDGLLLYQRLKKEFKDASYWTGEQCPLDPVYASVQNFGYGTQDWGLKGLSFRGRAVRRLPL